MSFLYTGGSSVKVSEIETDQQGRTVIWLRQEVGYALHALTLEPEDVAKVRAFLVPSDPEADHLPTPTDEEDYLAMFA
jgi:hypothetical protein